jgi:Zn-dependent protease
MALAFEQGYLRVGRLRGAPVRLHWSIPIGAVVLGRFQFVPWFWASFLVLVLIHELGHAAFVWAAPARVVAIDAHGAGGLCQWEGEVSEIGRALIAWGGVVAQAVVLFVAYAVLFVVGPPTSAMGAGIGRAFTEGNLWLIAVNLIPIPGFDGASAWPLFPALARKWRERRQEERKRSQLRAKVVQKLAAHDELERLDEVDAPPDPVADELLKRVFGKEPKRTK